MPCYDPRDHPGYFEEEARSAQRKIKEIEKYADFQIVCLRELLCSTCRVLERYSYDFGENPALDQWWDEHKKEDSK